MALILTDPPKTKARNRTTPAKSAEASESARKSGPVLGKRRILIKGTAGAKKGFVVAKVVVARANPEDRIALLRTGFPAVAVTELADRMGWSREHAFDALRLKRSTVMRKIKEEAKLETSESERLLSVVDIIDQVQEMVERAGTPEGFDAGRWVGTWLDTSNPALGGRRPAEYLDTHEGAQILRRLLAQMESGAYA